MNRYLSIAFVLALAACGGGGGSLSAGEAWHESNQRLCEKAHECMSSFDPAEQGFEFEQVFGTSVADCVDNFEMVLGTAAQIDASVEAGRIDYDEADAEACLASADITCEELWSGTGEDVPECETAIVGTVADGGSCTIDIDCANAQSSCTEGVCG